MELTKNYLYDLYSAWLGKIIGIRLGAPIEGWTYEKIKNVYGEVTSYPVDYQHFAADDDSNGPLFFIRALEDCKDIKNFSAQDVAQALLNYASYEKGFFWWGGYGTSTEHTAYLNLRNGIEAPRSGSIEQNGHTMAEQIGGQIFIDCWGLVAPGNPKLAAELAEKAASVTHGGNGIYGGIYVAVAISLAFVEKDVRTVLNQSLEYIPADCEFARVTKAVMKFYDENPENWRNCFQYIFENFGYDKYPGNCHIIPNIAVMILSMLYGKGDFEDTLNICNMCGWDTDCNVGNVGTIMGAICGIKNINYDKWIKPINDFVAASSVIGSLNIQDVSQGASYFAKLAYKLAEKEIPEDLKTQLDCKTSHFEFEGSTHSIKVSGSRSYSLRNTDEEAYEGQRSLKVTVNGSSGDEVLVYKQTYYKPEDFYDSRYDPSFSPTAYPGQTLSMQVMPAMYEDEMDKQATPYVKLGRSGKIIRGESVKLTEKKWYELTLDIPECDDYVEQTGFIISGVFGGFKASTLTVYLDNLVVSGKPSYTINFADSQTEVWTFMHIEINQFTKLKGHVFLEGDYLSVSSSDYAEMYTGHVDFDDYSVTTTIKPMLGDSHLLGIRVQGAMRSYAVGFKGDKLVILKNDCGYKVVAQKDVRWEHGKEYSITAKAMGDEISVCFDEHTLSFTDSDAITHGCVGLIVHDSGRCLFKNIIVKG